MFERRFPWFVTGLLVAMAGAQIWAAWYESQTYDEAFELGGGYSYWTTGDFRINTEQPPVQKYWCSLPLLFMHLRPVAGRGWNDRDDVLFGREFLYRNTRPPDTILFAGRLMTIALTLALGITLALWMRRKYGARAALIALVFYAFDPNLIAHGHYTTTDFGVTVFCFLTMICWNRYLETGFWSACVLAGLALGLAIGSKFSAVFLIPVMILLWALHRRWRRWPALPTAGVVAVAVLMLLYAPEARSFVPVRHGPKAVPVAPGKAFRMLASARRVLPSNSLLRGLEQTALHQVSGHPAYLLGKESTMGWWYYFPVVFAVKTPVGTLLACLAALAVGVWQRRRIFSTNKTRGPWLCMAVPFCVYWLVCLSSNVDIGVRHLLPVYPFLCALLGISLSAIGSGWLAGALLLLTAGESVSRFPYYTAFFNILAGGPDAGPHYLVDSNLDWGQDLKRVRQFMQDHDLPKIRLQYFGGAEPGDFGIWYDAVPLTNDSKARQELDEYAAISVTLLNGHYIDPGWYAWLRELTPTHRIGYSIYVYDLRKHR